MRCLAWSLLPALIFVKLADSVSGLEYYLVVAVVQLQRRRLLLLTVSVYGFLLHSVLLLVLYGLLVCLLLFLHVKEVRLLGGPVRWSLRLAVRDI